MRTRLHPASRHLGALVAAVLLFAATPAAAQVAAPAAPPGPGVLVTPKVLTPVPGTRVSLAPPPGFLPSDQFPGFHSPATGASIVVTEIGAPVEGVRTGVTRKTLAEQGMELLSSSRAVSGGILGTLYSVREQVRGQPYRKWMTLFGNQHETVMLSASFPEKLADELALPLKDVLLGAGWNPRAEVDTQAGLPFRVRDTDGLAVAQRFGNMLVMADPDRGAKQSSDDPMLVVGEGVAEGDALPLDLFARQRLQAFDRVRDLRDIAGEAVVVDGRQGYELTATAVDVYRARDVLVYQLVVPEGRRYTLVQALVGVDEESLFLPRFRAVARGLTFTK